MGTVVAGVKAWIAGGVSGAVKAVGGPLTLALLVYAVYLGNSIRWNMTFQGGLHPGELADARLPDGGLGQRTMTR